MCKIPLLKIHILITLFSLSDNVVGRKAKLCKTHPDVCCPLFKLPDVAEQFPPRVQATINNAGTILQGLLEIFSFNDVK